MNPLSAFFYVGQLHDNIRYWNDYYRNTGKVAKYPFKTYGNIATSGMKVAGSFKRVKSLDRRSYRRSYEKNAFIYYNPSSYKKW